ncbi:MAG: hypothetical protein JSU98_08985 [Gemmatimonadales bacterium]|nr:MAG: hypothetical protein JSU98_08985 [Gemmatimonadales bacterium]
MSENEQGSDRALSRRQFDEVIRRAAELTAQDTEAGAELGEADLFRIAREVGLPERHVRHALSEVRAGAVSGGLLDRFYGPAHIVVSRVVPGSTEEVAKKLDDFLVGGRLLHRVRRTPNYLQYRPAVDWISSLARAASATSQRYYVASAKSVEVRIGQAEEGRTLVEFVVDPGIRGDWVAGGVIGGGAGGLVSGVGSGVWLASVSPDVLAVGAGVLLASGIFAVINRLTASGHRKKWQEILAEVEGILDRLEVGETLEPPPASWRRWVERQFHGARRLLEPRDDDNGPF